MLKRPTIADVARAAGVSAGTVSAVLNARPTVRDATRARVLQAIDRLGYLPSASAQRLGSGGAAPTAPPCVGLVIKEVDNPFYAELVLGASAELDARGVVPLVCASEGDFAKEGRVIDALRSHDVRGVVVAPVLDADADLSHLFLLRRAGFPFVLLETVAGLPADVVCVDNVAAAQGAVQHLVGLGHERIVHFAGPAYTRHSQDRRLGFEKAFSQSALRFSEDAVVPCGSRFDDGYRTGLETFNAAAADPSGAPTAVACFNDLVALGLLRALAELGLRVPEDVSVVGFDDVPEAARAPQPLTTVHVPKREMGARAARLVLDASGPDARPQTIVLPTALEVRATTAPPGAA